MGTSFRRRAAADGAGMTGALVTIVAVLGIGNPAVAPFQRIELPVPVAAEVCPLIEAVRRIAADPHVQALERQGWRVIFWDCVDGQPS